jgi:site-specific DNA-methyltransferase (adenine-specific)
MVINIEDAGFEIKDIIAWIYGSGFPKSMNLGDGRGTALKPAMELWTLARKPLSESTIAKNILKWGTGGINIDGCRVDYLSDKDLDSATFGRGTNILGGNYVGATHSSGKTNIKGNPEGRFPANVILDEEAGEVLDKQAPKTGAFAPVKSGQNGDSKGIYGDFANKGDDGASFHDGELIGASRFFYCAKASKEERNVGCYGFDAKKLDESRKEGNPGGDNPRNRGVNPQSNFHPTVKPLSLMRYFCRLVTPVGGTVLDPYAGSGTTVVGAKLEGFNYIAYEKEKEYCDISRARVDVHMYEPKLF